jgi:ABC-type nitrate/sulfonate/bicarbonate transport system permease component
MSTDTRRSSVRDDQAPFMGAPARSDGDAVLASGMLDARRVALVRELPQRMRRFGVAVMPAVIVLAALIALWQWYASQPEVDPQLLPTPLAVWTSLVAQRDILWHHTLVTLNETLVGFAVALAAGVLFGTVIDFSPWLRRALYPLLVASQTIPIITLAPLLVLWFGYELLSKSIVVLLVCFFPITVALADGLRAADPELIKLYRAFGAGPLRIFWSVRLPGALPSLFSGIRIAITYSVIGAIFAEYVGASAGLGLYIELQQHSFATAGVIAGIVVTAVLSVTLFLLTALIERIALPWYYLQGRTGGA